MLKYANIIFHRHRLNRLGQWTLNGQLESFITQKMHICDSLIPDESLDHIIKKQKNKTKKDMP